LMPLSIGAFVGLLAALMGVGGGFIMVPAMIYLLGMPTSIVAGTSLFQILFVVANVTFLQAYTTQSVDIILALFLLIGSVIGVQFGTILGGKISGPQFRILLALMVLVTCGKLLFDLAIQPDELFSIQVVEHPK
jgi:uncharacterized membrane protein YfcA